MGQLSCYLSCLPSLSLYWLLSCPQIYFELFILKKAKQTDPPRPKRPKTKIKNLSRYYSMSILSFTVKLPKRALFTQWFFFSAFSLFDLLKSSFWCNTSLKLIFLSCQWPLICLFSVLIFFDLSAEFDAVELLILFCLLSLASVIVFSLAAFLSCLTTFLIVYLLLLVPWM